MIPLVKSTFYKEEEVLPRLADFVRTARSLSMGEECARFEQRFAAWQGRKHCILVNSGSSANLALVQALLNLARIEKGDAIGFSAVTWATNVMPLLQLGLRAIPIDVELDTMNVSSRQLLRRLERVPLRALFLTDLLGWCDDIDRVREICAEHGTLLIEDACEAVGTVYRGTRLGNFGLAATFSFYVAHQFSTIEGGAACTDDDELADMLRIVRAHGWDRNLDRETQTSLRERHRVASTFYSRYTFYDLGYNLRPTEIAGFLGNAGLPYLDEAIARRQANYRAIAPRLAARPDLFYPLRADHLDVFSNFAVPVLCRTPAVQRAVVEWCEGRVETRPVAGGDMTRQPFFRKYRDAFGPDEVLPHAATVHAQGLYVGNHPELTAAELDELVRVLTAPAVSAAATEPVHADVRA